VRTDHDERFSVEVLGSGFNITAPSPDLDHFLKTGWGMYATLFVEELMNNYVKF
jgi:hypothetical protein